MVWRLGDTVGLGRAGRRGVEELEVILADVVAGIGAEFGMIVATLEGGDEAFTVFHKPAGDCAEGPPPFEEITVTPIPDAWYRLIHDPDREAARAGRGTVAMQLRQNSIKSLMATPIFVDGRCAGSVSIGSWHEPLTATPEVQRATRSALAAVGLAATVIIDHVTERPGGRGGVPTPRHPLSPRQTEVMELFTAGLHVPNIAERLFLSPATVRNHLKAIFRSYGVTSQAELVSVIEAYRRN